MSSILKDIKEVHAGYRPAMPLNTPYLELDVDSGSCGRTYEKVMSYRLTVCVDLRYSDARALETRHFAEHKLMQYIHGATLSVLDEAIGSLLYGEQEKGVRLLEKLRSQLIAR